MNINYFAYGSNMSIDRMKERRIIFEERVPGIIKNWRLTFNKLARRNSSEGYANIVPCTGARVEGVLYIVPEIYFNRLDIAEGIIGRHYYRDEIDVLKITTNQIIIALVYIACKHRVREGLKPSKEYLYYLLSGSDCLSPEYLEYLKSFDTLD